MLLDYYYSLMIVIAVTGAEVDGLKTGDHYDMNVQVKVTDDT